jgi:hypothetical protein
MLEIKKMIGLCLIAIFALSTISPSLCLALPTTDEDISAKQVQLVEQSIDNATYTDNDWRDKLNDSGRAFYDYVYEITGHTDAHIVYEIVLMFNKQLGADQQKLFLDYCYDMSIFLHKFFMYNVLIIFHQHLL